MNCCIIKIKFNAFLCVLAVAVPCILYIYLKQYGERNHTNTQTCIAFSDDHRFLVHYDNTFKHCGGQIHMDSIEEAINSTMSRIEKNAVVDDETMSRILEIEYNNQIDEQENIVSKMIDMDVETNTNVMQSLYANLNARFQPQLLEGIEIEIFGCGSLGSHIAHQCASMGVKYFNLYDFDLFEIKNLISSRSTLSFGVLRRIQKLHMFLYDFSILKSLFSVKNLERNSQLYKKTVLRHFTEESRIIDIIDKGEILSKDDEETLISHFLLRMYTFLDDRKILTYINLYNIERTQFRSNTHEILFWRTILAILNYIHTGELGVEIKIVDDIINNTNGTKNKELIFEKMGETIRKKIWLLLKQLPRIFENEEKFSKTEMLDIEMRRKYDIYTRIYETIDEKYMTNDFGNVVILTTDSIKSRAYSLLKYISKTYDEKEFIVIDARTIDAMRFEIYVFEMRYKRDDGMTIFGKNAMNALKKLYNLDFNYAINDSDIEIIVNDIDESAFSEGTCGNKMSMPIASFVASVVSSILLKLTSKKKEFMPFVVRGDLNSFRMVSMGKFIDFGE